MSDQTAKTPKIKVRNYSFNNSKRLPESKMTEVNGIKIPSMPGSCYHAIICALAQDKNKLVAWDRIVELTERYICQYGGRDIWDKFVKKSDVKSYQQRIKDNTHTLTRTGKDCYGYRLHERGMAIYFFKDGAILFTNGEFKSTNNSYDVIFPDGRGLQVRYRGTTMTSKEYKRFLDLGYIDPNGRILDSTGIKRFRAKKTDGSLPVTDELMHVCVTLGDEIDQDTAIRLESLGFVVEEALDKELIGRIPSAKLDDLQSDKDVAHVDVA